MASPETSIVVVLVTMIVIMTVNITTAMPWTLAGAMTMGMAMTTTWIVTFLYYGIKCEHDFYNCYPEYCHSNDHHQTFPYSCDYEYIYLYLYYSHYYYYSYYTKVLLRQSLVTVISKVIARVGSPGRHPRCPDEDYDYDQY